ncbi:hypothetical protein STEG23_037466 [Scotinomys teguina]
MASGCSWVLGCNCGSSQAEIECYVLTSMAYDRYIAICNPLLYHIVMSPKLCLNLMLGSYFIAFSDALAHTASMLRLTFCDANTINHYFCDIPPLLQLSCTSTYVNKLVIFIVGSINIIVPTSTIFISYGFILSSIFHISSSEGRSKAFNTCSSHIIAVSLFFGSDFCYSSVFTPKMLMNFLLSKNVISYMGCMTQVYFFCFFAISECYVLTSMAYDRYVAICNPLLYTVAMSPKLCLNLMLGTYAMAFSGAMAHTGCMLRLTFCDANTINHYFCDLLPVMQLSCTSTYVNELVVFIVAGINIIVPSITIFVSYGFIVSSICRINFAEGRSKAFSTCSSHIIAISLFFGSGAFMYLKPSSSSSMDKGKTSSVFYTNVVPMMNPLIYSLRNKDVKMALRKTLSRWKF